MIVALYKIWRGHEFVIPSIESIYPYVGKILMISSDIGWNRESGNTVAPIVCEWVKKNDLDKKVTILGFDSTDQDAQYKFGMKEIRRRFPTCEWVLLIDTDEVWDDEGIRTARDKYLRQSGNVHCFRCCMYGYIKDIHYRIIEANGCKPPVFVRPWAKWDGVRGNKVGPACLMEDVYVHHITAVRDREEDVFKKFFTSSIGDGNVPMVDMNLWKKEVWDKIPDVQNFHYNCGSEKVWKGIEVISDEQLPLSLRRNKA